jgi:superfamily II DNA or RNA helicase
LAVAKVSALAKNSLAGELKWPGNLLAWSTSSLSSDWPEGLLPGSASSPSARREIYISLAKVLDESGALRAGVKDLARADKEVSRALRGDGTSPMELLILTHFPRELPKSCRRAWACLAADLGTAWTALEVFADFASVQLVRRSGRVEGGCEVLQLALRGPESALMGPAGVGVGQRLALHQAALALLETLARPGMNSTKQWPGLTRWPDLERWPSASGLVEKVPGPEAAPDLLAESVAADHKGAGAGLLLDALEENARRTQQEVERAGSRVAELEAEIEQTEQQRARAVRFRAEALALQQEVEALEASGLPDAERQAASEALQARIREHEAARAISIAQELALPGVAWRWLQGSPPPRGWAGYEGVAQQVGTVEGRPLWAAQVRARPSHDGRREARLGEADADGGCVWRGPVRLSHDDALDAAALLACHDVLGQPAPDPHPSQAWHGLLLPEQAGPCIAELVRSGALPGFEASDEGAGPFTSAMSCQVGGKLVAVEGAGSSQDEAREQCARQLLGVLAGEVGFGTLTWTSRQAQELLGELAQEPWLDAVKRRSRAVPGGGHRVEMSCQVGGTALQVEAVAADKRAAERAAAWLLVQRLGAEGRARVLDPRPHDTAGVLEALREHGVVDEIQVFEGPGGPEAVLATVVFGEQRLWAAGSDAGQASRRVLAAVRCWMLAPQVAQASKVGAPHPEWPVLRPGHAAADEDLTEPERLRRVLRDGARLCAVGLGGGMAGFVVVPPAASRRSGQGGGPCWRLWSERGVVQVQGPPLAVPAVAEVLVGHGPEPEWDASVAAWREVLWFGCAAVAAGQVWPGVSTDGCAVWRPGPFSDGQVGVLRALARALPPWAHSEVVAGGKGAMVSAESAVERVLVALADGLVRGPGVTAVWGVSALTGRAGGAVEGAVAQWLDAVEEIADAVPPPGVVLSVLPPPQPRRAVNTLRIQVRLRPPGRARQLVTLPAMQEQLGSEHPAVGRALRALRKAATCWPVLLQAVAERADQVRVAPGEAALLLGQLGRALARAGVEIEWPQAWAQRLRPVVVAGMEAGAGLSLDQLVDYRWQMRLDGTVLSAEECVRIAEAAGTLVWLRERWVLVDTVTAERARGGRIRTAVPVGEALAAVLLGTVDVASADHADDGDGRGQRETADLVAEGGLGELAALLSGDTFTPIDQPEGLAGQLWPYQRDGLTWLANVTSRFGALLGDEMGLGKSVQTIALMVHRRQAGASQGLPVLLVAPASMVLTWARQLERFAPGMPVRVYHGTGRSLDALEADTVVVTSYGTLLYDQDLLAGQTYSLVVADEAQHVKNPSSKRSQALARMPGLTRVALTGTPVENGLKDLWALLNWTNPALFASLPHFMRQFGALEAGHDPEVAAAMNRVVGRVLLRRRKTDPAVSLQLPDKIDSSHILELTPSQMGLYTRTAQLAMDAVRTATGPERSGLVLRLLAHLRQVCNSPLHLKAGAADSGRLDAVLAGYDPAQASQEACKLAALDDLVPAIIDAGESVVMFSEFRTMAMLLRRHAAAWGVKPLLHTGAMTSGEQDTALTRFRRGKSRLLIVTYGSGGTGLDLTVASHAVLVDRPFNPARTAQAVDRLHRPGQNSTVHAHHLRVAGTVEDKIDRLLTRKLGLLDALATTAVLDPAALDDDELHDLVALGAAR